MQMIDHARMQECGTRTLVAAGTESAFSCRDEYLFPFEPKLKKTLTALFFSCLICCVAENGDQIVRVVFADTRL